MTIVEFAEEQEKDKYCIGARTKYEEAIRIREELLNDIEKEMKTLKENIEIKDSPRDGDEGYLSEDDKIDDEEEIIELDNGLLGTTAGRILVPEFLKENILKRFHDSPYAGHLGIKKTAARIQRRFKWPKMGKDIKEYVRGCEICTKRKAIGNNKSPLNPIPPPETVWQVMAMDIMGPIDSIWERKKSLHISDGEIFKKIYNYGTDARSNSWNSSKNLCK